VCVCVCVCVTRCPPNLVVTVDVVAGRLEGFGHLH
jgi:hypothetical protein